MTAEAPPVGGYAPVQLRRLGDGVSSEEIAAVLAALAGREHEDEGSTDYDRWRDSRVAALRARPRRG